jgi:hypothetical protein
MKLARQITVPATATSVAETTGSAYKKVADLLLQAPVANAANIFFGTKMSQPGILLPGGTLSLEGVSLADTYVVGNGSDSLIILVTR